MAQETQEKCKETQRKNWPLWAIILTSVTTVVSVLLLAYIVLMGVTEEEVKFTLSDWVEIVLPVVGAALVVIFAFLGVDRLKNFDERQDRLAKDLRHELQVQVDNAVRAVKPDLESTYSEWENELQNKLSNYSRSLDAIDERIHIYDDMIGSVKNIKNIIDTIGNIEEARNYILNSLFLHTDSVGTNNGSNKQRSSTNTDYSKNKLQRTRVLSEIINRIQSGTLTGESSHFHNLSVALSNLNYSGYAADVVKKGLKYFPSDIDLISDYIMYSQKAGRYEDVQEGIDILDKINRDLWNWRAFTFYIDVINSRTATPDNKEIALTCVEDYKRVLPKEERAYMAEYETYLKYGDTELAEAALKNAEVECAMTAQCSLSLSERYHMRGEYDSAIRSASLAILGQAERQPSSRTEAAFAQRAFSKDAKIHKSISEGIPVVTLANDIRSALIDYEMALRLTNTDNENIHVRIFILENLL